MPEVFNATKKVPRHNTTKLNSVAAFLMHPSRIRFETQTENEDIVLFLRQHFIVNAKWIFISLILLVLPFIFFPYLLSIAPQNMPVGYFVVLPFIWYVGVFGYVLVGFMHWYFNIYIVTTDRIVDIDWVNLLYKDFSSTTLSKIQDVKYRQGGILELFFNFGNVFIQTAGTDQNFEFESVPRADVVVQKINELIKKP